MQHTYDVVIVGGGGSGLAAAARCAQLGVSAIVLEKRPAPGGATGIAVGSFTANRTDLQRRQQVEDSLDAHAEDAGQFASPEIEARNHAELRRYFLSHTADTLRWLMEMGLQFHGPSPEPPNRVPRMHNVVPNAKAYIAALRTAITRGGGTLLTGAAVVELRRTAARFDQVAAIVDGRERLFVARRGVVLAAGDYANASDLIGRFKGEPYAAVEGIQQYAHGDGQRLVEQAGGRLVNMDVTYGPELRLVAPPTPRWARWAPMAWLPTSGWAGRLLGRLLPWTPRRVIHAYIKRQLVTWQHPEDSLFDAGAILVNRRGERFCDERCAEERELAVARQPEKLAFILLDAALMQRYSGWPHFISTAPEIAYAYVDDYLRLRPDVAVAHDTLPGVAEARGIPAPALEDAVRHVNQQREQGAEPRLSPLRGDQWLLLGPVKAYFTTTEGGAAINQDFEVLDEQGDPLPGLYAIGQNGLGGQILWGHGLHIAWAITSGKLVAEHLAGQRTD